MSGNRDIDISLSPNVATYTAYQKSDFIGPSWKQFGIHLMAGAPLPRKNYLTIFKPFDTYVWVFLIASIIAVSGALIFINKINSMWSKDAAKDSAFQSTSATRLIKKYII